MIQEKIKHIIAKNLDLQVPLQDIRIDTKLADIGISSITFIKIIVAIETEFDFQFDDVNLDYGKYPDFGSLISYVQFKVNE